MANKNIVKVEEYLERDGDFNLDLLWEELQVACPWVLLNNTSRISINYLSGDPHSTLMLRWKDVDVVGDDDPVATINAVLDAHDPAGKSKDQKVFAYFESIIEPHVGKDARELFDKSTLLGVTASMFFWIMGAIDTETYTILPLSEWGRSKLI